MFTVQTYNYFKCTLWLYSELSLESSGPDSADSDPELVYKSQWMYKVELIIIILKIKNLTEIE